MVSSSSSSSSFFDIEPLDDGGKARPIAMDACSLCQKPLGGNCDIFMYRGDTPFCSVECRYYQMAKDEISVKATKHGKKHSAREEQKHRHGTSASESRNVSFVANVIVAG